MTREILETELAVLPPTDEDLQRYRAMLSDPDKDGRNLVAVLDDRVIGTVTYGRTGHGAGNIGVFVADELDGTGVGDALLETLIRATHEPLEVSGISLPVQVPRLSRPNQATEPA